MAKKQTVNWKYENKNVQTLLDIPPDTYGFVYQIDIWVDGEHFYYIGQKKLISRRKKKFTKKEIAQMPNKRAKKWKWVESEMDWQNYLGSNKPLLELIKKHGAEKLQLKKEILKYCKDAQELKFFEAKEIICSGGLEHKNCFNNGVSLRIFKSE